MAYDIVVVPRLAARRLFRSSRYNQHGCDARLIGARPANDNLYEASSMRGHLQTRAKYTIHDRRSTRLFAAGVRHR